MAAKPLKEVVVCHVVPFLLYSKVEPVGEVTTIVPVVTAQVGWVRVAAGLDGGMGTALIAKLAEEKQLGSVAVLRTLIE